mmetsp:Transcript_10652/g.34044  ORF Transcript_10652/g.34044 Transcript_10652/m.34044 type:complete len:123 (+) Transcript_10652:3-371(+)
MDDGDKPTCRPCLTSQNGGTVGFRFFVFDLIVAEYCHNNAALGGACVGALSTVLNNPVDVVKSEMQQAQGAARYPSMLACARHLVATKGPRHLLGAGLSARIVKISLGQAVIFQTVAALSGP